VLLIRKDKDDKIIAYIDFQIVDRWGHLTEGGQYCYVRDAYIWRGIRGNLSIFRRWVEREHPKYPQVRWIYFQRSKYNKRLSIYDITKFYKQKREVTVNV